MLSCREGCPYNSHPSALYAIEMRTTLNKEDSIHQEAIYPGILDKCIVYES
jgi:hypothetical protein